MDITLEKIEEYKKEGIEGLVKSFKESPTVMSLMDSSIPIGRAELKSILALALVADSMISDRFTAVSIDITLDAVTNEFLPDKQPEHKETDAIQKAVGYFKESKYYKAWLEAGTGTDTGLTGAVLITYALDGKFNELCRKAGLNCSSAVARVIVTRLMEQKHE